MEHSHSLKSWRNVIRRLAMATRCQIKNWLIWSPSLPRTPSSRFKWRQRKESYWTKLAWIFCNLKFKIWYQDKPTKYREKTAPNIVAYEVVCIRKEVSARSLCSECAWRAFHHSGSKLRPQVSISIDDQLVVKFSIFGWVEKSIGCKDL